MFVAQAQAQMRASYRSGSVGAAVASAVWLASASTTVVAGAGWGIAVMLIVGFFIYPLTQLVLRALGGRASVPSDNPLRELSVEVPIVGPAMLPLVGAATLYRTEWFYPALMLAMGAHYVPFSFLYGMRSFIGLGAVMAVGGLAVALWAPSLHVVAAFCTALLMLAFAVLAHRRHVREQHQISAATTATTDRSVNNPPAVITEHPESLPADGVANS